MNILATVCKSGGDFGPADVIRLAKRIRRHLNGFDIRTRMICLTDLPREEFHKAGVPVPTIFQLRHGWPGWWSKIELFRPGLFSSEDRVLHLDLDTVPVGDFSELWQPIDSNHLFMLKDFYRPLFAASGVMGWRGGGWEDIFTRFHARSEKVMGSNQNIQPCGDGAFISSDPLVKASTGYWQDRFPGRVVSYKAHCQRGVPSAASLVCFHGRPRPTEVDEPWL
ncbi:MAG: hypothetical protein V3R83_09800 [Gammaproteobacteria bacterium]